MLEINDLHVNYAHVEAVRGVSLSVQPGKITLVLGPNGAGKTTTLKAIAGIEPPVSGTVTLDGADITGLAPHAIVRRGVALVPEGRRVFGPLTVAENLRLGGYTASKSQFDETLARVYEMFPILRERSEGAAGLLSGGEQQMLAFGRALMSQPKVMLMDEPSMGLAPVVVDTVLEKVRAMADGGIGDPHGRAERRGGPGRRRRGRRRDPGRGRLLRRGQGGTQPRVGAARVPR